MRERLGVLLGAAASLAAALAGCASMAPAPSPAQVDRLAQLFVQAMPVDWVVDRILAQEPQWPLQGFAGKYTREQLACTRTELGPDKVTVTQREDARAFARRHPERVAESIEVLEGGAAEVMNKLMREGAGQALTGKRMKPNAALANVPVARLRRFVELSESSRHAELRKAMRLDGMVDAPSGQDTYTRGRQVGRSLLIVPMLAAVERCGLSLALLMQPRQPAARGKST